MIDLLIFGGGIAGLWLSALARAAGYSVALLEKNQIGSGQSLFAQGIIHGGIKYALHGRLSASAQAIAAMPSHWRACLNGQSLPDLKAVPVLSEQHYLFSTAQLHSKFSLFLASRLLHDRIRPVFQNEYPEILAHADFKGQVYALNEPVIDPLYLLKTLFDPATCWQYRDLDYRSGRVWLDGQPIQAKKIVLAAGAGNASLAECFGCKVSMQKRPLHMVMLKSNLPAFYAHVLTASALPRLTITSHGSVWYLGGLLAEQGVERSQSEQIKAAQNELQSILPWLSWHRAEWKCVRIDRAEYSQPGGKRPDDITIIEQGPFMVVWPTKLALAPRLAARILQRLDPPSGQPVELELPKPRFAQPPYASFSVK